MSAGLAKNQVGGWNMVKKALRNRFVPVALTLAVGVGMALARERVTEEFHHPYPLSQGGRVSLENVNGDVSISAWDRNEVKVDAVKFARDEDRLADIKIEIDARPDSIHIKTRYPHHFFDNHLFGSNPGGVEYTLTVPRSTRIEQVELVNGALEIEGLSGDVKASLVNGNLKARGLRGETELSTVNGRVEVTVDQAELRKRIDVSSVNGGVELSLPADVNARLEASTVTGGVSSDFGVAVQHNWPAGNNVEGELGRGGPQIHLSNVNGHISIRSSGAVPN